MKFPRRAPGAKSERPPKQPTEKKVRPPKVKKEKTPRDPLFAGLRAKIHSHKTRTRVFPAPSALRKKEMLAVTGLAVFAVLAVTGIAAVISYSHMNDWALANHEPDWRARLFPLSVDGSILAASLVLYADSRAGRRADKLAYLITVSGLGWSVGANIGHTWVDPLAAKMIAGWPPIAMFLSVELLFRFARRTRGQADAEVRKATKQKAAPPAPVAEDRPVTVPKPRPAPAPRPEPEPVAAPVDDGQPEGLPLHSVPSDWPDWLPAGANAGQACIAYLTKVNPDAKATEVDEEVGKYIRMSDGYARRKVREFDLSRQKGA